MQEETVKQLGARTILGLVGFALGGAMLALYAGFTLGLLLALFRAGWGVFS